MIGYGIHLSDAPVPEDMGTAGKPNHRLRLLLVMARGSPGEVPEAWRSYARIEDARASAREALRNPLVQYVAIIEDDNPLRVAEWVR